MMPNDYEIRELVGLTAVDRTDSKVGTVADVYADDQTGQPEWLAVNTGLFGTKLSFVPLTGAEVYGDTVFLSYDKDLVKDAPKVDADGHLDPDQEEALYSHYGLTGGYGEVSDEIGTTGHGAGYDVSGPETDDAMTRAPRSSLMSTSGPVKRVEFGCASG